VLNPFADELVERFNIRFGYSAAPQAMAQELIEANLKIMDLERQIRREERKVSAGYVRRHPEHRARKPKPQLADPICDTWIKTGAET
jgi:hypothetical protein